MKELRNSTDRPDGLIHRILSRLQMTDVVKTCILSKRWRYIWTSVNIVRITVPEVHRITRFVDFVDKVLNLGDAVAEINKFYLIFSLSEEDDENLEGPDYFDILTSPLNVWITSVIGRNVKTLSINFSISADLAFELPVCLFNCKTLVKLRLKMGGEDCSLLVVPKSFCLPRLISLDIHGLSFENPGAATRLISSCPVLEDLDISDTGIQMDKHQDFIIDSSTLEDLGVWNGHWPDCLMGKTIKLNTPNLKAFYCTDFMRQEYAFENLSSLVHADISISVSMREVECNKHYPELYLELSEEDKERYGEYVQNLLGALRNLEELTLSDGILEVASGSFDLGTQLPQFYNLRILDLSFWLTRGCLRSLVYLLTISPNAEFLQLCLNPITYIIPI